MNIAGRKFSLNASRWKRVLMISVIFSGALLWIYAACIKEPTATALVEDLTTKRKVQKSKHNDGNDSERTTANSKYIVAV